MRATSGQMWSYEWFLHEARSFYAFFFRCVIRHDFHLSSVQKRNNNLAGCWVQRKGTAELFWLVPRLRSQQSMLVQVTRWDWQLPSGRASVRCWSQPGCWLACGESGSEPPRKPKRRWCSRSILLCQVTWLICLFRDDHIFRCTIEILSWLSVTVKNKPCRYSF